MVLVMPLNKATKNQVRTRKTVKLLQHRKLRLNSLKAKQLKEAMQGVAGFKELEVLKGMEIRQQM